MGAHRGTSRAPQAGGVATGMGVVAMTAQPSAAVPRLVMLAPESFRGREIDLLTDYLTVGREPSCDVCLDDPHVSRTHAALQRLDGAVYVQDLGSSGGTFVNGSPARRVRLRHGDVVTFAAVQARFEAAAPVADATQAMPTQIVAPPVRERIPPGQDRPPPVRERIPPRQGGAPPPRDEAGLGRDAGPMGDEVRPYGAPTQADPGPAPQAGPVRYDIGQQHGQMISNVGRDQYNAHVQQVIQQRDSFLREVAATRTKARWLVWLGLLLFVAGFALFAAADLNLLKQIANDIQSNGTPPPPSNVFGRPIFGVPSGLVGWALGAVGGLMLVIGIVLHIVATSRRRRVEREYPLPMPWAANGPPGRTR
jgi:pSer/pThr/pTyr-binding forkhead associated (FHA) protein